MRQNAMTAITKMGYIPLAVGSMALAPLAPPSLGQHLIETMDARTTVESHYEQWRDLMEQRGAIGDEEFTRQFLVMLRDVFDTDQLASETLKNAGTAASPHERERFTRALEVSLKDQIVSYVAEVGKPPTLRLTSVKENGDEATVECSVEGGGEKRNLTLHMVKTSEGLWKISDVHTGKERVTGSYGRYAKRLLDKYSFPYLVAELSNAPFVVLEDFEEAVVGELPVGWKWKDKDDDKRKPYRVDQEGDNKYLAARDEGESVIIAKDLKWDLREFPYVSFRWRVHEIPEGADERLHDKVDSAAGIYFVYRRVLGLVPESVKYVWSSTLPVGSAMQRSGLGKPWMVVVDSGKDRLGEWRTYVFDFAAAYKDTFGGLPPKDAVGIGILSDANNTINGHAYADYDDIRALRSADSTVTSGVREKLQAQ
jgi:ABC-type transporter MlaC component